MLPTISQIAKLTNCSHAFCESATQLMQMSTVGEWMADGAVDEVGTFMDHAYDLAACVTEQPLLVSLCCNCDHITSSCSVFSLGTCLRPGSLSSNINGFLYNFHSQNHLSNGGNGPNLVTVVPAWPHSSSGLGNQPSGPQDIIG